MTMVVTEPCFGCKSTACVTVCPSDSFREGADMLFIAPTTCIDCYLCVETCPTQAIFHESEVPAHWQEYIALNQEMADQCPPITERRTPFSDP